MEELPTLVLIRIVDFLTIVDVLSFRFIARTFYDICEETHFRKVNEFNTIVLFRRQFVDSDDFFNSIESEVSEINSKTFGEFNLFCSKSSTLIFLKYRSKILNLGYRFDLAYFFITNKRGFYVCDIDGVINGCSVIAQLCSNEQWLYITMNQDHQVDIFLRLIFHPVQFLYVFSCMETPKMILGRYSSSVLYFNKSSTYFVLQNKYEKDNSLELTKFDQNGDVLRTWKLGKVVLHGPNLVSKPQNTPFVIQINMSQISSFIFREQELILCKIWIKRKDEYQLLKIDVLFNETTYIYFGLYGIDGRGLSKKEIIIFAVNIKTKELVKFCNIPYVSKLWMYDQETLKSSERAKFFRINHHDAELISIPDFLAIDFEAF